MSVIGVEMISAQGQPIIKSESPRCSQPYDAAVFQNGCLKTRVGTVITSSAMTITIGVYTAAKRSTNFSCRDRFAWVSVTNVMMRWMVLSLANFVTRTLSVPWPLTVLEKTSSPSTLATSVLSPVIGAWLTSLVPLSTRPSIGKRSPGRTTIVSPSFKSTTGTETSPFAVTNRAFLGARSANSERIDLARSLM